VRDAVLIIGGGPAGLALAIVLARAGVRVWVVESGNYTEPRVGEHLPPGGIQTLHSLVPDRPLSSAVHQSSSGVDAYWGGSTPNQMDYLFHPIGTGANLTRPTFDRDLATTCRDAGATIAMASVLISASWKRTHWATTLGLPSGSIELFPAMIVDATGRRASFARSQGGTILASDQQIALVQFYPRIAQAGAGAGGRLLIEAAENGWWYFAPLSLGRSVAAYTTDADLLPRGGQKTVREWWINQVRSTVHVKAKLIDHQGSKNVLLVRWARSQRLSSAAGKGWLAVGDAACAFDPLESNGIAKALEGARKSADAVLRFLSGREDLLREHTRRMAEGYNEYRRLRRGYYLLEARWPSAPFWHRRQCCT